MAIQLKRVYQPPSRSDGFRILVDRLWPGGISKQNAKIDLWPKELAPSTELRHWYEHDPAKWTEFKRRYYEELEFQPEQLDLVRQRVKLDTVTFVYSSREDDVNNAAAPAIDLRVEGFQNQERAEISGLAVVDEFLLLLPQHEPRVYWLPLAAVDEAVGLAGRRPSEPVPVAGNSTELKGSLPPLTGGSGWEAIVKGSIDGEPTLFLADEDALGSHAVYQAKVRTNIEGIDIAPLEFLTWLPSTPDPNLAYESLAWTPDDELIAIPELSDGFSSAARIEPSSKMTDLVAVQKHSYRISDVSAPRRSSTQALGTSFCWNGEAGRCDVTATGASNPVLLCLRLEPALISIVADLALPLAVPGGDAKFNVEGIVAYRGGVLIVNVNSPGGAQTTLRYLADDRVRRFCRSCLGE